MALRSFREGDKVKAIILSIDNEKRRISFGLKPSYFADEDFEQESDQEDEPEALGIVEDVSENGQSDNGENGGDGDNDDEEAGEEDDQDDEDEAMDVDVADAPMFMSNQGKAGPSTSRSALKLDGGFQWSVLQNDGDVDMEPSEGEDDEDGQTSKKKKRKHKEIEQDLTADLQTKMPESNADFERVLLGSPNSSFLWIQYMSFQLQLAEVDKAREIAQRALKTINFREEQEKLNVWIALLNLENVYGTDESLEATFKNAARHNDSKTIHLRLAAILDESEKFEVRTPSTLARVLAANDTLVNRKLKSNISGLLRSSATVRRSGHSSLSITFVVGSSRKLVLCYPVVFRVSKSGNVGVQFAGFTNLAHA